MSILEKLGNIFSGGEEGEGENKEAVVDKEKEAWTLKNNTRLLNIFIANHGVSIGEEFYQMVINESGLSPQEIDDMKTFASDQMPQNEMSPAMNLAYADRTREKIVGAIKKMDVGEVPAEGNKEE